MNKILIYSLVICMVLTLSACSEPEETQFPTTPQDTITFLKDNNILYQEAVKNSGDISSEIREDTAQNGQSPYAVVITCADSRVAPEHIFMAGIGELFIIRNAGNVVDEIVLGSAEYGAEHLDAKVVVVLGHTLCGAVDATINDAGHDNITFITDRISEGIGDESDPTTAERLNVENSVDELMQSEIIKSLVEEGSLVVVGAIYDTGSGAVTFM